MSRGYIDPQSGTHFYGDEDATGPVHDVLNRAQEAEHLARLADRARLTTLEDAAPTTMPTVTPANGYALDAGSNVEKIGGTVLLSLIVSRPAGITSAVVGTLPPGSRPASTITTSGMASMGGAATLCTVTINPSGDIRCWTASAANTRLDVSTLWQAAA